ncbi:zinc ABC transporter substrate-binding protein AztC [Actinoplanes sp. NPDC023714]|uniref:zinc ABC transporter substrate-binding protein AztC n=1 Tax=Actinoplanes sp. NPDC023714 TaxID=3154322 RepID=UPI0033EF6B5D
MRALLVLALLLTGAAACSSGERVQIVVTTNILGDVVREITGDEANVAVLMRPEADPHSFGISAREAHTMQTADLVVYNGLGLEEGVLRHVESAAAEGVATLEVGARVEPLEYTDGDAAGSPDPHFWTDPRRMAVAVDVLSAAILENVPGIGGDAIRTRAAAYKEKVSDLDARLAHRFGQIPAERRVLVTNHHVFGYLAARYDLRVIGAIIPSGTTLASPSASDLASLVTAVRDHDVRAIFADTAQPARLAAVLAEEAGLTVSVVGLYSESVSAAGGEAPTYLDMMRFNAEAIIDGLTV